jgi:hypothetical protein
VPRVHTGRECHLLGERTKASARRKLVGLEDLWTVNSIHGEEMAQTAGFVVDRRVPHRLVEPRTCRDLRQMNVVVPAMKGFQIRIGRQGCGDNEQPIGWGPVAQLGTDLCSTFRIAGA